MGVLRSAPSRGGSGQRPAHAAVADRVGQSAAQLLRELPEADRPGADLLDLGRQPDRFYIPTRYPDAHPAGAAHSHYSSADAVEAVASAREVLSYCERQSLDDRP